MKKALLLFMVCVIICALLAGCGSKGATTANSKEMVIGVTSVQGSFNPYGSLYGDDGWATQQVYDSLVIKDENNKIAPSLAESWDVSEDGLTLTFHIRPGVKFSNGAEFTAADAKFNVDTAKTTPTTEWSMSGVANTEAVDKYIFQVTLSAVDMSFFEKLAWMNMVNKDFYEKYGDNYGLSVDTIVGTGAYTVTEWKPGEVAVLKVNQNYFKGEAPIKNLRFKSISDLNAAMIALQTGEINLFIQDVPNIYIDQLQASGKVTVTSFPSNVFMDVLLNCKDGLFSDIRLRQALAYGVDRQKMLTIGTEGQGVIVDYPGGPNYIANPNIKCFYDYDLEKAKALVQEAGAVGKEVVIKTMDTDPWPKLATSLQEDLSKIGLSAKVEQLDGSGYGQEVWTNKSYEIAISRYWSGTQEMVELMALVETDNPMNFSNYSMPAIDPLIQQAATLTDESSRKQLYEQAIRLYTPEVPLVPLYYSYGSRAYSSDLTINEGWVPRDLMFYYSWK